LASINNSFLKIQQEATLIFLNFGILKNNILFAKLEKVCASWVNGVPCIMTSHSQNDYIGFYI